MYLLSGDWHLDDDPANESRWQVLDTVRAIHRQYPHISRLFILGDLVDRKDRFPARFINRLLQELASLGLPVVVLRGNHDTGLNPPSYFDFLAGTGDLFGGQQQVVEYVTEPTGWDRDLILLPFTPDPADAWADIRFEDYQAAFMHQTVTGSVSEKNGIVLENPRFPVLPPNLKVYSGDIHKPQRVGQVLYVGSPHQVHFGDDQYCRMLLVDEASLDVVRELTLNPPSRLMVDVDLTDGMADLSDVKVNPGDQVKIRLRIAPGSVTETAGIDRQIAEWAEAAGAVLVSSETRIATVDRQGLDIAETPQQILRRFADQEGLSEPLYKLGLELLEGR